jgi:hypothetical protein
MYYTGKTLFEQAQQNANKSTEVAQYYSMLLFGLTNMGETKLFELLEQSAATGQKIVYDEISKDGIFDEPNRLRLETTMKEELTKKMHNEFNVDAETDKQMKVWAVISMMEYMETPLQQLLINCGLTMADYEKYKHTKPSN